MIDRTSVFVCDGLPVRMAARREDGRVLVEYLQVKTRAPLEQWRLCFPHQLRAERAGVTIGHIKSLVVTLPLARFAGDPGPVVTIAPPPLRSTDPRPTEPERENEQHWWQKL